MDLKGYVIRRVLLAGPVLLIVTLVVFFLFRVIPGDPARLAAGMKASEEKVERIRKELGLDKPVIVQYLVYVRDIIQGDFGTSIHTKRAVIKDLKLYFPATFELCLVSMIICILVGIPLGITAAVHENRWPDHISRVLALSGVSIPIFWLALLAQLVFWAKLSWVPGTGRISYLISAPHHITGMYTLDSLLAGNWESFTSSLRHLILPALCLSFVMIGYVSRMTRSSMLEVMRQEFIRTARAKGLSQVSVLYKHALRNALIPVVTVSGALFAQILGGVVVTETIFSWKGLGLYLIESILRLDLYPIAAFTILSAFTYVAINLVVDVSYFIINPETRSVRQ
jgi:peptide/nickel transport system permease protein